MNEGELLLAEIMKRTEEENMLHHYPKRFQDWWDDHKHLEEKKVILS